MRLRGRPLLAPGRAALADSGLQRRDQRRPRRRRARAAACWWAWPSAPNSLDPALASSPRGAARRCWLAYTPPMTYRRAEGAAGHPAGAGPGRRPRRRRSTDSTAFRVPLPRRPDLLRRPAGAAPRDFPRACGASRALNPAARRALAGVEDVAGRRPHARGAHPAEGARPRASPTCWPRCGPRRCRRARRPATCRARRRRASGPTGSRPRTRGRAYVLARRRGFRLAGRARRATSTRSPARWCPTPRRRTSLTLEGELDVTQGEPPRAAPARRSAPSTSRATASSPR